MTDFFISYTGVDHAWAEWIAWQLQTNSYTVVLQAWHFDRGTSFVQAMHQASIDAERTIAVLSPDYLTARFTQPEWQAAFAQDPTGEKGLLLPIRVRRCDPPGMLAPRVYIDLVGLAEDAAQEKLLTGVRRNSGPTTAPSFPGASSRTVPTRPRFPGTLPPVWNVPHHRNPNFTGREELLAAIHQALTSGQPAALTQALSGLGGIGKTQLAVEYAYRHAADYSLVWWVRAEEPVTLGADYASLATALQLPEHEASDQTAITAAVRRWLEQHTGWLLVFDNAVESAALRPYLPRGTGGHVLITSRNPLWRGGASPLPVRVFERTDAVTFLLHRTGDTDAAAARTLAERLGDLPLALEQAGAYIDATGISLTAYLQRFTTSRQELLRRGTPATEYPDTVATTWEIAMQRVQHEQPAAADLLHLCAFLAPDDIPYDLIRDGRAHLPKTLAAAVTDPLTFDAAVAALRRYSLLEVENEALRVHRLVQAVARDRLGEEDRLAWAAVAVRLVQSAFQFDENAVHTWPICARLLPHALSVAEYGETWHVAVEETGVLLSEVGGYLRLRAQFNEARTAFERALAIAEVTYGPNHPAVATEVNNLGCVLRDLGELAAARAAFERALASAEATYGPSHPTVANCVNNLGSVLRALGELAAARAAFERALASAEATYGPSHPSVAIRVNNLGSVLQDLGELAAARAAYERAVQIFQTFLGAEHPSTRTAQAHLDAVIRASNTSPDTA